MTSCIKCDKCNKIVDTDKYRRMPEGWIRFQYLNDALHHCPKCR